MKSLFWVTLTASIALIVVGALLADASPTSDPGSRNVPTPLGYGVFLIAGGVTLAVTALVFAMWWSDVARAKAKVQAARPDGLVFVAQAPESLKRLAADADWPKSTYVVCVASSVAFEVWGGGRMLLSLPAGTIDRAATSTVTTSRDVPAVVRSGANVEFELVPGRPGWEMFPILDWARVAAFGEQILRRLAPAAGATRESSEV